MTPQRSKFAAAYVHAPAANTAAVVTIDAGGSNIRHGLYGVHWSYVGSGTLSGGNLKIEDGSGTTVFTQDISAQGAGFVNFHIPHVGTANTALIVTLAAGGANVTGKVSLVGVFKESADVVL